MHNSRNVFDWEGVKARIAQLTALVEGTRHASVSGEVLANRTARYRAVKQVDLVEGVDVVVFHRGEAQYAVALQGLAEIRRISQLTEVPGISPILKGLINVRGRIVSLYDLAAFQGKNAPLALPFFALIDASTHTALGLCADEVEGVRRIPAGGVEELPLALSEKATCFEGVLSDATLVVNMAGLAKDDQFFRA